MDDEPKKGFVISIPRIEWRSLFRFRSLLIVSVLLLAALIFNWWVVIRPYFWVHHARVEAFSSVFSSESGRVAQMGPEVGDVVKKGDLLFALDTELTQAMQNRLRHSIEAIHEQSRLEKIRLEKAMQDYVSASAQAEMGYEISDQIRKHLSLIEDAQSKSEKADRELQLAHSELAILELQEKKMRWEAPFDGIVLFRSSHVGAAVSFGHPVYSIYDPSRMWIEAEIPEANLGQVKIGADARICFPAFPKKEWQGKVFFIGPSAHQGSFQVKISVEDKELPLRPGLSAEVGVKVH